MEKTDGKGWVGGRGKYEGKWRGRDSMDQVGRRWGGGGIVRRNLLPPFIVCQEMSSTLLFYAAHKD